MSLRFRHLFFPPTLEETRAILNSPTPENDFTRALDEGITYLIVVDNILSGKAIAIHTVKYLLQELRGKRRVESTYYWRFTNMLMQSSRAVGLIGASPPAERYSFNIADGISHDTSIATDQADGEVQSHSDGIWEDQTTPELQPSCFEPESTSLKSQPEPEETITPPSTVPLAVYGYIESARNPQQLYEPIGTLAEMLRKMELEGLDSPNGKRKRHNGDSSINEEEITNIDGVPISIIRANEHLARAMGTRQIAGPRRLTSTATSSCHTPIGRDEIRGSVHDADQESDNEELEEESDDDDLILLC